LKQIMTYREFKEWVIFDYRIDPGYPMREDVNAAVVAQQIYNCHRTKGQPKELKDFIVKFDAPKPQQQRMKSMMTKLKFGLNKIKGKKNGST